MKAKHYRLFLILTLILITLTGCSSIKTGMQDAMANNKEVILSVAEEPTSLEKRELTWVELDQLSSFKDLRKTWDNELNIIRFGTNSKNGAMFIELDGNWAGNNTLYNVFQNKVFVNDYYSDGKVKSKLAQAAMKEFSDVKGEAPGIAASVNAYFNILATNTDGTSGMENYLTRAEAMAAIYRADTPVTLNEIPEDFVAVVGENVYNEYAYDLADYSYLDYRNGSLNSTAYNDTITRIEVVYMLVKRYFPNDLETINANSVTFNDCTNAGKIESKFGFEGGHAWQAYTLEYSLQNPDKGVSEELYKALAVAKNRGIITSDSRWNSGIRGGELITFLVNTYQAINQRDNFKVNAKTGSNVGESLYVKEEAPVVEPEQTEQVIEIGGGHKLSDLADIDDLIAAYGDEIDMTPEEIEEAKIIGAQFTIEEYDTYLVVDHCRALNVRTGPSTDYRIMKSVPKGTIAHVVGVCAENGWYRVIANGKISYQCGVYFSEQE